MAVALMSNNKLCSVTPQQALLIWRILNGEIEPTEQQARFCEQVKTVYLNWGSAPQNYRDRYPERAAVETKQTLKQPFVETRRDLM